MKPFLLAPILVVFFVSAQFVCAGCTGSYSSGSRATNSNTQDELSSVCRSGVDENQNEIKTLNQGRVATPFSLSEKPVLIQITTNYCLPCNIMKPWIAELRDCYREQLDIIELNIEEPHLQHLGLCLGINTIPTQIYINGENAEIYRHAGLDVENQIKANLLKYNFILSENDHCSFGQIQGNGNKFEHFM